MNGKSFVCVADIYRSRGGHWPPDGVLVVEETFTDAGWSSLRGRIGMQS